MLLKQPPWVIVEVGGVGYELEVSLTTFGEVPNVGEEAILYTHLAVRDDAHLLYGFANLEERSLFRTLIRVTGVGAKLALLILSGMNTATFARCIQEGDTAALMRLPGIGKRTAERLVVEMRDRLQAPESGVSSGVPRSESGLAPRPDPIEDAISALVTLGYKPADAVRMVKAIDSTDLSSDQIIRQALQAMVKQ
jgi:Holliday junction DNA helicase RuvA